MRVSTWCWLVALTTAQAVTVHAATWTEQSAHSSAALYVVHAVNPEIVWAAGNDAQVVRTTDGGSTWVARPTPGGSHWALFAFDDQTCVVAGWPGSIWRTSDGGLSWDVAYDAGTFINGIHFFDAENGWAVGDPVGANWVVLETTDGGSTWTPSPAAPPAGPGAGLARSLSWLGDQIGVFGTSQSVIRRTTNGGGAWSQVAIGLQQVAGLVLSGSGVGLAAGDTQALYRTTDFGATWAAVQSPTPARLLTFDWIAGSDEVWGAAHQAGLFHSTNAGGDWEVHLFAPPFEYIAEDLDFANRNTGWSVGEHAGAGAIWKYDGGPINAVRDLRSSPAGPRIRCTPNPFRSVATFRLDNPAGGFVEISIHHTSGRLVALLVGDARAAGVQSLRWDGTGAAGRPVAAGTYFHRARTAPGELTGKLVRAR